MSILMTRPVLSNVDHTQQKTQTLYLEGVQGTRENRNTAVVL
jgi:hypothetical protein